MKKNKLAVTLLTGAFTLVTFTTPLSATSLTPQNKEFLTEYGKVHDALVASADDFADPGNRARRKFRHKEGPLCRLVVSLTPKNMIKSLSLAVATFAVSLIAVGAYAAENPMVGGAPMSPSKDIIDNAVNSKDHTTLVAAVKAAGLVDTLKGKGPFTIFAPTNEAFEKLPAGTVDSLLKPENKEKLTSILTYHVVSGKYTANKLAKAIKEGDGEAKLKTVNGEMLTARMAGDSIELTDTKGGKSTVTIANVIQSNGVIHVVDTVLMP